jgi:chemotaxis protein CheD
MNNPISIGLGEMVVKRGTDDILVAYGLGSCLAIGVYDPVTHIAGMIHAVLPRKHNENDPYCPKYVDTGIPGLIEAVVKAGADRRRLVFRMAGGANMLLNSSFSNAFEIGSQNIKSAHEVFDALRIKLANQEVGGNTGRTVRMYVTNGRMTVRMVGGVEQEL